MQLRCLLLAVLCTAADIVPGRAAEAPVKIVAQGAFRIDTPNGPAYMPIDLSLDWNRAQPQVKRALVVFHGKGRDVDGYYRAATRSAELAGGDAVSTSIVAAPQFLTDEDIRAHSLPHSVLRWEQGTWESGADASAPVSISAYEVIDTIVAKLADRKLFPNLERIVIAGHSGGGQGVQRYAVVGRAEAIAGTGISIRYVVANPSSYLYFADERPKFEEGHISFAALTYSGCQNFNHWRYGITHIHERYVTRNASDWQSMENAYANKDVIYLLGTADIDPHQQDLDVSCAGELEGPNRLLRGEAYYAWLHNRHTSGWNQQLWLVPGVAHSAGAMFRSPCGVAALFEKTSCSGP